MSLSDTFAAGYEGIATFSSRSSVNFDVIVAAGGWAALLTVLE